MEITSPQKLESKNNIMKEQLNPAEYGQGNSPGSIKTMTQQRINENYHIHNNCLEVNWFIKILSSPQPGTPFRHQRRYSTARRNNKIQYANMTNCGEISFLESPLYCLNDICTELEL
ncbi:hypothetical protein SADUNF_Sadunf08G0115900 [Salix dunnii]|uniref:Uncharacterized protein n=1 Tax=Salix dunnii TaxID=1413687 RepID=A0A835JXA6_9ROSI|nr:hypothetical protein SADUNF_Sadunf08G0115900 [Salix dunnii]